MKKYNVHVILGDKFHSVVIECASFYVKDGSFIFYTDNGVSQVSPDYKKNEFAFYPVSHTVIEEHKEVPTVTGSGGYK